MHYARNCQEIVLIYIIARVSIDRLLSSNNKGMGLQFTGTNLNYQMRYLTIDHTKLLKGYGIHFTHNIVQ